MFRILNIDMARILLLIALFYTSNGFAKTQTFDEFLSDIKILASKAGVSTKTLDIELTDLKPNPRVIELDRKQPEFTQTFWDYLIKRVSEKRVERGIKLYKEHYKLLNKIQKKYGVPGQFLIAFWGLETNFGDYIGAFDVVQSLATLAYDLRRRDFFTKQLIIVLKLIDNNKIPHEVKGSWAGAMGFTQFMPSNIEAYAIDFNDNGKLELWSNLEDIFASSANFLKNIGWKKRIKWGREVMLPDEFDYGLADLKFKKPINYWKELKIKSSNGSELPSSKINASLILPMGYKGPAFLVYANFNAILNWNRSILYAITVGHLSDRILGLDKLKTPFTKEYALSIEEVIQVQKKLNELGFNVGKPDGIIGPKTRLAVKNYQLKNNLAADGYVGSLLYEKLNEY